MLSHLRPFAAAAVLVAALFVTTDAGAGPKGRKPKPTTTTTLPTTTTTTVPPPTTTTTTPPSGTTYSVPASIPVDCSRAVEGDLMAFFATVPNGSTIAFAPGGCYGYDGSIRVYDRTGLTFDGNGSTFRALTDGSTYAADSGNRMAWSINGGGGITLREMTIRGAHPNGGILPSAYVPRFEGQHGIGLGSVQGALVEDVAIFDVYGDFVAVQWDFRLWDNVWAAAPVRDVVIRRLHAERNGRQGLFVGHAERVTMTDSYMGDTNQNHVDLEPDVLEHMARDVVLTDNRFGPVRFTALYNETGVAPLVGNVTFSRNVLESPGTTCYPPIFVVGQAGNPKVGWTVENNTITQGTPPYWSGAFSFTYATGIGVRGNTVNNLSTAGGCGGSVYGVRLRSSSADVVGNHFGGAQVTVDADSASTYTESGNTR